MDKATTLETSVIDFVHILYSNCAACFLKLNLHDKALAETNEARKLDPKFVKELFRIGFAYHALKQYKEALPVFAEAHKKINKALQFAEVGFEKDTRSRINC